MNATHVALEAPSPFELRVGMGAEIPEADVHSALESGDMGFLHSFTTGSTVDGPGVRVVAWTSGCGFRCLYCHNPDTWKMANGLPVPLTRAIEQLVSYRATSRLRSGGFTLSGGEPLLQDRFAVRLFNAVRAMGVHTAIDTNGFLGSRLSDEDLESIDLVLLCIKAWDRELHRRLTGVEAGAALDFARRLAARKRPAWLRYVIVPGLTDHEDDVAATADFVAGLGNFQRIDILPFHQMGRFKWRSLGMAYELDEVQPPTPELVDRVCSQFRAVGLEAY